MSDNAKPKEAWFFDKQKIFSNATIGRTKNSGGVYQFRYWLAAEKKYKTSSLFTKDRDIAIKKAEELYLDYRTIEKNGGRLFAITVDELCDWYMEQRRGDVAKKFITPGRLVTIRSQVSALRTFLGPKTKITEVNSLKFEEYTAYRQERAALHTIKNERSTISHVFLLALKAGKVTHEQIPEWEKLPRISEPRRQAFRPADYDHLYRNIRFWAAKGKDDQECTVRSIIHHFVLICSNTGMRFGEARQLKWRDVRRIYKKKDDPKSLSVELFLPADITKTRESRTVIGLGGQHFRNRKENASFKSPEDFVFCIEKGKMISKKTYYSQWSSLMDYLGFRDQSLTYYSLRHTYATMRIITGNVHLHVLGRNMGCSVAHIEKHYAHVKTEEMVQELTNVISKSDALYEILQINE